MAHGLNAESATGGFPVSDKLAAAAEAKKLLDIHSAEGRVGTPPRTCGECAQHDAALCAQVHQSYQFWKRTIVLRTAPYVRAYRLTCRVFG